MSALGTSARISRMLMRPGHADRAPMLLAVLAWSVVTALTLTVVGGAMWFYALGTPASDRVLADEFEAQGYAGLATMALVLLVVPLISLGGAAARLAARRRDERLSSLSLLGAERSVLVTMTVLEATLLAAIGAVVGFLGYLALMPVVGMISFVGAPIGAAGLWPGALVVAATFGAVLLVALLSSIGGLRAVVISPLGVRTRQDQPKVHWARLVLAALGIGAAYFWARRVPQMTEIVAMIVVIGLMFLVALAVLNVVGPFVVRFVANRRLSMARTPRQLLAARAVLEDPKGMWRQVGGVAMICFVAVIAGTGFAMIDGEIDPVTADIRTGVLLTLGISFATVACSVGVNQAAAILDRGPLYRSLRNLGTPVEVMHGARVSAVMPSLTLVALGSAALAGLLIFPLAGAAMVMAPLSVMVTFGVLLAGIGIVYLGVASTRPVLTSVLRLRPTG